MDKYKDLIIFKKIINIMTTTLLEILRPSAPSLLHWGAVYKCSNE